MTDPITSRRNPRVVATARLDQSSERKARGETLLEGPHLLQEAVARGVTVTEVYALPTDDHAAALARAAGAELIPCSDEVIARIATTENPRGPMAVMRIPPMASVVRDTIVPAVNDPGNAGTLIRSAASFGLDVVVRPGAVDVWSPKVLRAGAGAHFHTRVGSEIPPGHGTIATVVAGGMDPAVLSRHLDRDRHWAILVGSEAHGLEPEDVETADLRVTIPMPGGTESLNAGVAGSILAYEFSRWRMSGGRMGGGG